MFGSAHVFTDVDTQILGRISVLDDVHGAGMDILLVVSFWWHRPHRPQIQRYLTLNKQQE